MNDASFKGAARACKQSCLGDRIRSKLIFCQMQRLFHYGLVCNVRWKKWPMFDHCHWALWGDMYLCGDARCLSNLLELLEVLGLGIVLDAAFDSSQGKLCSRLCVIGSLGSVCPCLKITKADNDIWDIDNASETQWMILSTRYVCISSLFRIFLVTWSSCLVSLCECIARNESTKVSVPITIRNIMHWKS